MRYAWSVVILGLAAYLLTGFVQVRPGERAVVRRFGRVVDAPGPGLWVGLPWGMDRVDRVPVDMVRRVTLGYQPSDDENSQPSVAGQLLTGDHNLVNLQVIIHYTVHDVVAYLEQAESADDFVARAAESYLVDWAAGLPVDHLLIHGKTILPSLLAAQTQERIEPYHLGIEIQAVDVGYLYPPSEVKSAFEEVTRAETSIRTREHEARQEAAQAIREAETERYRLETETQAYVARAVSQAEADAVTFSQRLAAYRQNGWSNPNYLAAIWWDEMGKLLTRLKANGRVELLDQHLAGDGLDITVFPPGKKK
jgi:membrane protease subunit HflK